MKIDMVIKIGIGLAMMIEMISGDRLMTNVDSDGDYDGKRDNEDVNVHREALRGGGWCLEWLHPPPKGVQREGKEREREREETRTRVWYLFLLHRSIGG